MTKVLNNNPFPLSSMPPYWYSGQYLQSSWRDSKHHPQTYRDSGRRPERLAIKNYTPVRMGAPRPQEYTLTRSDWDVVKLFLDLHWDLDEGDYEITQIRKEIKRDHVLINVEADDFEDQIALRLCMDIVSTHPERLSMSNISEDVGTIVFGKRMWSVFDLALAANNDKEAYYRHHKVSDKAENGFLGEAELEIPAYLPVSDHVMHRDSISQRYAQETIHTKDGILRAHSVPVVPGAIL